MSHNILDSLKNAIKKHPNLYKFIIYFLYPVFPADKSVKAYSSRVPSNDVILNLGSGPTRLSSRVMNVDIHQFPNVDIIADVHHLPFKSNSVGGVISVAMLEHVENPQSVVAEMHRVIKHDGYIYALVPFIFGYHSAPSDYYRWTSEGIKKLFGSFAEIEIGVVSGPTCSLLIILQEWLSMLFSFQNKYIYQVLYPVFMIILAPFKILDFYLIKHPEASKTAATFYYIGQKKLHD